MPLRTQSGRIKKKKPDLLFVATCGAGLEDLVAGEITALGGRNPETAPGAVRWQGNLEAGYRLCLWSRFASRILLQIAAFEAADPDTLYRQAGEINWDEHFGIEDTFAVACTLAASPMTHSQFAALRIKDAIVDQFRARTGLRPTVDVARPDIRINLHVRGTQAFLALDLSGESLHRRGYRVAAVAAPLKESLAAAIVQLAGWRADISPDSILLDPMCGSGTLLIEAALIFGDSAPGLQRRSFGFMAWRHHNAPLWKRLVDEALDREELGLRKPWPRIIGYDADPHAVAAAGKNIATAGLEDKIQVKQQQLAALKRPGESGMLLVNPPYGERLSNRNETKYLYRCLGRKIGRELYGWQIGFFAADPDLASMLRLPWEAGFHLFNGPIKCRLHRATAVKSAADVPPSRTLHHLAPGNEGEDFANRLRKNCISLFKWAAREDVSCFRIYDRDIPEYNLAVDLYEQWVHVQEYAPPPSVEPEKAAHRFNTALRIIRDLLAVPHSRVFVKTRQRQKGKKQYQKRPGQGKLYEVREQGCRFLVNFTDYLDTGLFLDHRKIRAMLGGLAAGTRFLNLFGYTGTATVHALMNGAAATTLVDSSATYLQRARANMALNGFGGPQHVTVQSDCRQWLQQNGEQYDLIFVDPPTFSNDRHKKTVFEVQKDHEELLRLAMQHLAPAGLLIFSTNFRKFQLAESLNNEFAVREITGRTIPEDFKQKSHIHRCWEFRQPATNR